MDYKFVQLLTMIGFILCVMNAIGCINYLVMSFSGMSIIRGVFLQTIFGMAGIILLIGSILAFQQIESSL